MICGLERGDARLEGSPYTVGFLIQLLDCFPKPALEETLISDGNSDNNQTFHSLTFYWGHNLLGKLSKSYPNRHILFTLMNIHS